MGTRQHALVLQDTPIHVASYLIIIIVIVIVTAYILSLILCFLLSSPLLVPKLPCLLVPLGRNTIRCHQHPISWHQGQTVLED